MWVGDLNHADAGSARDLVAVKVFRTRTARDAETLFRLRDVGRDISTLRHPVLSPPLAVVDVSGRLGLVSEYVDGIDLFDLCEVLWETEATLHTRVICGIVAAVAEALDAAQLRIPDGGERPLGRMHRDLKPANVMIDRSGGVRLLDLGVGLTSLAGREARAESLKKGLTRYLSPGRREGKRGGPPSDIYALGMIGVELARGGWLKRLRLRNPDHDRHLAEVVARIKDLGFRTEGNELAWRNLFLRMVAHDPDARPDAAEVASVCRTLQDSANGPNLPAFAVKTVAQWLEPVPQAPDPELDEFMARILHTVDQAPEAPVELNLPAPDDAHWIETADGWQTEDQLMESGEHPDLQTLPPEPTEEVTLPGIEEDDISGIEDDDMAFADAELTGWSKVPVNAPSPTPEPLRSAPTETGTTAPTLAPVLLFAGAAALAMSILGILFVLWWLL
ncbi:MAG: serine/threonine protein kinase [Myxococcota bacterium]